MEDRLMARDCRWRRKCVHCVAAYATPVHLETDKGTGGALAGNKKAAKRLEVN